MTASHSSTPSAFQQVILQKSASYGKLAQNCVLISKLYRFSSEQREKTLLNLKKNDNIMWRQCGEKIDFYQEVLLLDDCSVLRLGCNLVCFLVLVLILHFQPPQGSDGDNKTKKEI